MRIIVTGAAGFIGRALVHRLGAAGHELVVVVRAPTRSLDRARQIVVSDLAVFKDWSRVITGADALIHLAGIAHRSADRHQLDRINVGITRDAARAAADAGSRFVYVSSVKVHGEETNIQPFCETSPIAPRDEYGKSKAATESALREVVGLRATVLRPPLVYGPGVKANFLALMRAIAHGWPLPFGGVENRRSLLYVGNLCDAIVGCLEAPQAAGRTYIVSDGTPVSTSELCRTLAAGATAPRAAVSVPRALARASRGVAPPHAFARGRR